MNQYSFSDRLDQARKFLADNNRESLNNPHAMIGRKCRCKNCFCCAAAQIVREYDGANSYKRYGNQHMRIDL